MFTLAQLKFQRDTTVPSYITRNTELRGRLIQWGKTGAEPNRIIQDTLLGYENSLKVYRGFQRALLDDTLFDQKTKQELELRARVVADPQLNPTVGSAWEDIERAEDRYRQIYDRYLFIENGAGFNSKLFNYARQLVRGAAERAKPNEQRLREYADSNLPKISGGLLASTPVYPDFEQVTLSFSLDKMREILGPDDPMVRSLLSTESPDSLATALIRDSKLADPAVRKALWEGGESAIAASNDSFIKLARQIDPEARAVRKVYEDEVQAGINAGQEKIAKARFAILGTNTYPDATFTLRLSDMSNTEFGRFQQNTNERATQISLETLFFTLEINKLSDADMQAKLGHAPLRRFVPWLDTVRAFRPHQLPDDLEKMLHERDVVGRQAWMRLFDETMADLRFDVDGKKLTSNEALNLLYEQDGAKRKMAADAVSKGLGDNKRVFALVTNTLAKEKEIDDKWRKFARPVSSRNLANQVEDEVVDALVSAVQGELSQAVAPLLQAEGQVARPAQAQLLGPQRAAAGRRRHADRVERGAVAGADGLQRLLAQAGGGRPAPSSTRAGSTCRRGRARRRAPSRIRRCRARIPICC